MTSSQTPTQSPGSEATPFAVPDGLVVSVPDGTHPVFARAQAAIAQLFERFRARPAEGRIEIGGHRYLLLRAAAFSVEFYRTVRELFGEDRHEADAFATRMLYDLARATGRHDAEELQIELDLRDPLERLSAGPVHFAFTGWSTVVLSPLSRPVAGEDFLLVYEHPSTFEAESWIEHGDDVDLPVCATSAGYSTGWCEHSFGLELDAVEIACRALGDDTCRFVMTPPHRMDQELEHLRKTHPEYFGVGYDRAGTRLDPTEEIVPSTVPGERSAAESRLLGYAHALKAMQGQLQSKIEELEAENKRRRHMQRDLELTQRVLDEMPTPVVWIGRDGRFLYVNRATCALFDEDRATLLQRRVLDVEARARREDLDARWRKVRRDGNARIRTWYRQKDGGEIPVEVHANYHRDADGAEMVFCFVEDISEVIAREEKLLAAQRDAESRARSSSDLLATMSHELRTPLAAVVGMTDLLQTTELDDEQREFAQVASEAATHLHTLIDSILEFSRLEAGAIQLENLEVDIRESIQLVLAMVEPQIRGRGVELRSKIADAVPERVWTDPGRLRQVLLNLLSNAAKFTEEGFIEVRVRCLDDHPEATVLAFEVEDTGPGIVEETRATLFEPYRQADASVQRRFGGAGLGLAISQRIVDALGGEIGVRSRPGEGSTFWFDVLVRQRGPRS